MPPFLDIVRAFLDAAVRLNLEHQVGCGVFVFLSIFVASVGYDFPNPAGNRITILGFGELWEECLWVFLA